MSWFKKLTKKTRKPSKHPPSMGTPSHIRPNPPGIGAELDTDDGPEGASNEEDSRIVALSGPGQQLSHAPGASTAMHEQEHKQRVPPNVPNEQLRSHAPGPSPHGKGSGDQNRRERNDQGAVTGSPLSDTPPGEGEVIGGAVIPDNEVAKPGFGSLKAILAANSKEIVAIRHEVKVLLSQIGALEESFDSRPSDREELNRRIDVIHKFKGIEGRLRFLSKGPEPQRLADPSQDLEKVSGLLDELRKIIFDYQMVQQMAVYEKGCNLMSPDEAIVLNSFRSAQGAEYGHGDRKGCLKGTRGSVLNEIELWTRDFHQSPVYWLNGLAGTGKTTIAQTVAERVFADGRLGASFFCSSDFEDRSNLQLIFPTLAVQLARKYTEFRSVFVPLVQSNPGIAYESLYNQMDRLIVRPLTKSAVSTVIIIDALDECKDEETTSAILSVLGRLISKVMRVKFFLTGRPEPRIQTGFRLPLLKQVTDVFVLHDVDPKLITNDIGVFLKHCFLEVAHPHGSLDGWPTDEEVEHLCNRAAGLFIYAVATVKFVNKRGTNPRRQLDLLLQSPESSVREAKTKFKTNTSLDSLYTSILRGAFGDDDDPDNDPRVRSVLGVVLLTANPLSPSTIAMLLGVDVDDVFILLSSAQSLFILQDINSPVRPFHKSFPDFVVDPDRCTDHRFYVSPPHHHSQLLITCLDLMDRTLERNMCRLPDGIANSDVKDLEERTEGCVDPALRYACRSWHTHLVGGHATSANAHEITSALHRFLENKFLTWLEVLSLLGDVRNAVDALKVTTDWLEDSPTLDMANDCSRFVTQHFEIISASSPHIYHSALVLTPMESAVRKLYKSHAQPFVRVVHGLPALWDSNTATATSRFEINLAVWSPCNRFIAISPAQGMTVDVLDSETLQRLQSLEFAQCPSSSHRAIAFSPDSRMVTYFTHSYMHPDPEGFVVSWDLQTGGVVSTIERKGPRTTGAQITYSSNGKMVAVLSQHDSFATISVCDTVSGVHTHDVDFRACTSPDLDSGAPYIYKIWSQEESLRFAISRPTTITIWEVGFSPGATPTEVESVSIPDNTIQTFISNPNKQRDTAWTEFHPSSCRLAFTRLGTRDTLLVWDGRASKYLLHHPGIHFRSSMSFSSDGHFFACTTVESEVYFWRESPTGYTLCEKLTLANQYSDPRLSPNGESIITFGGPIVQLWHTKGFATTSIQALHHTSEDFVLEFLPDRPLAVVARKEEETTTVLDLKSGLPQLTIDTSIKVYGLRSIEQTIVVIGAQKAIIWNLPQGDFLPDARMDVGDSARTIDFNSARDGLMGVVAASTSSDFRYIAVSRGDLVDVHCASTGRTLPVAVPASSLWFPPSGHDIWCASENKVTVVTVTNYALDYTKTAVDIEGGSSGCPWGSSCGYNVTDDGWILGAGGKRLLMLPPLWQSQYKVDRVWNGRFLALLHGALPGPVILDLEP